MIGLCLAAVLALGGACLPAPSDQILARDLAAAFPPFSAVAPETRLGYAPAPGARRVYRAAELERLAARFGIRIEAREICFERLAAVPDPQQLLEAMQKELPEARIRVLDYSRFPLPPGEIHFPRAALALGREPRGPLLWRGFMRTGSQARFPLWARVVLSAPGHRLVAAADLARGRPIRPQDVRLEEYDGFPRWPLQSLEQVAGKLPRRAIAQGTPLRAELLDSPQEIRSGDWVHVQVATGAAHIALEARAEASGRRGQIIALRNPASGARFRARVDGPGQASVSRSSP